MHSFIEPARILCATYYRHYYYTSTTPWPSHLRAPPLLFSQVSLRIFLSASSPTPATPATPATTPAATIPHCSRRAYPINRRCHLLRRLNDPALPAKKSLHLQQSLNSNRSSPPSDLLLQVCQQANWDNWDNRVRSTSSDVPRWTLSRFETKARAAKSTSDPSAVHTSASTCPFRPLYDCSKTPYRRRPTSRIGFLLSTVTVTANSTLTARHDGTLSPVLPLRQATRKPAPVCILAAAPTQRPPSHQSHPPASHSIPSTIRPQRR